MKAGACSDTDHIGQTEGNRRIMDALVSDAIGAPVFGHGPGITGEANAFASYRRNSRAFAGGIK